MMISSTYAICKLICLPLLSSSIIQSTVEWVKIPVCSLSLSYYPHCPGRLCYTIRCRWRLMIHFVVVDASNNISCVIFGLITVADRWLREITLIIDRQERSERARATTLCGRRGLLKKCVRLLIAPNDVSNDASLMCEPTGLLSIRCRCLFVTIAREREMIASSPEHCQ